MPEYEAGAWDPPAPIVRATVRDSSTAIADVPMLIDTGSDVSVVPQAVVEAIGAAVHPSRVPVQFYTGAEEAWEEADLSVEFARFRFEGLFLVVESSYGILGRNILNSLMVTLDGPGLTWSVGADRA